MTPKETKYGNELIRLENTVKNAIVKYEVLKRTIELEEPEDPARRRGLMLARLRDQKLTLVNDLASILGQVQNIDFTAEIVDAKKEEK